MPEYKILKTQIFHNDRYKIVPIRHEDRILIMEWRNEQIYHLRQSKPLTEADQDNYFNNVVAKLFGQEKPEQVLFSYLENDKCIGYGGLVHINWIDKNAEISFIIDTKLEKANFHKHWGIYLDLIEQVAFNELKLHKIYTYAFDLRPHLYEAIEAKGYIKEAILKEHCLFDGEFKSVVIHSKINRIISLRSARESDANMTHEWANDEQTRKNSFSSEPIPFESHKIWWNSKMNNADAVYYICEVEEKPAGIVRFDRDEKSKHFIVGVTVSPIFRGKGLSNSFLRLACLEFFRKHSGTIDAYIKKDNIVSVKAFEKAGFSYVEDVLLQGNQSVKYELRKNENG